MTFKYQYQVMAVLVSLLSGPLLAEDGPIEADWLYLTAEGSWIARSAELRQAHTALPLPVEDLDTAAFWWQAEQPDLMLSWKTPERRWWVAEESVVQVDDWSGSWTVVQTGPDLLVLSQAGVRRSLPKEQWHRLSWVTDQSLGGDFELQVDQGEARNNAFRYAWFDGAIAAEVRYNLDLGAETPRLRQQLVLHNRSDYALEAPGYSYAQSRGQGRVMMARETMAMDSVAAEPPVAGDSSGQATLQSEQPLSLASGSHAWLAVQTQPLADIRHQYRFDWNTRRDSGTQAGQWSVAIRADDPLPDLAGPLQLAVWDREVALLETRYQPQQRNRASLALGASDMMTLATERLGNREWELTLTNRNSEAAEASLDLVHRTNDRDDQAGISLPVPGDGSVRLQVRLEDTQLTVRPL